MNAKDFNKHVNHPLQAWEWGEFRKKTGIKVIRGDSFQLTIHKIPKMPWSIGYLPKGNMPDKKLIEELKKIGKENNCIFIQLEPNVPSSMVNSKWSMVNLIPAAHPLFTKYTFILDLNKNEQELLAGMHQKTRYNIKVAQKHGVKIIEDNSDKAFKEYLKLTQETTRRQNFYAHTPKYHKLMWETLKIVNHQSSIINRDHLAAHLLLAKYKKEILAAWILFTFKDTLYYPYGASSEKNRETMASNLIMWETIKFGKKLGLKQFDMWGALSENPDPKDPWYGFHRFKQGYGGELVEFIGNYDLVINPALYNLYKVADKIRWMVLRLKVI
ncbi:MAG: peptidoglycan bridge formation glycyltransferase FemA/FemB family protein [Candidatus Levybacteria bacterium]|nr:peptidoglycan bridge formation glycyltransferase FemA/FemB family protein [Candidatus Levybacteria bacterium]